MRTLLICALATTLVGCSSQQSTQPSCVGLNPFACLTAVHVPIEPESHGSDSATAEPVSLVAWRGDRPPRSHADHAVRRTPKPIKVAAKAAAAVPIPMPSPQANQQTTGNAVASEAPRSKRHAVPIRFQRPTFRRPERHRSRWRPPLPSRNECRSRRWMRRWTLWWPSSWRVPTSSRSPTSPARQSRSTIDIRKSSIGRVRTAMAAAGAPEIQLSKGQTTAINRLVAKEVSAAVVGLVSANAADSFPELARFRIFRVPLSASVEPGQAVTGLSPGYSAPLTRCRPRSQKPNKNKADFSRCGALGGT